MATNIENIPAIMRHHKWAVGAALMDSWFSRPVNVAPKYGPPNTTTVTMNWVLSFLRARRIYDKLMADRIWANSAAQAEIVKMLRRNRLILQNMCYTKSFGRLSDPVPRQDPDYINQRALGMSTDLDDLNAALANFVFNVVVAGTVQTTNTIGEYRVEITEVGVYAKDSYDFVGSQFLGYWDDSDNSVSMINPFSGTEIRNQDFRDWRAANSKGGDFQIFSDLKRTVLKTPDVFTFK